VPRVWRVDRQQIRKMTDSKPLDKEIVQRLVLSRVVCEECDEQPGVFWKGGQIVLGCDCGQRKVPEDAVLNHDEMPDDVQWTVEDPRNSKMHDGK